MEAFTTKGHWWLPGCADIKAEGELTFDPGGGSGLKLSNVIKPKGMLAQGIFPESEPIILGVDDEGQAITLVQCAEEPLQISISPLGILAYRPRYIVRGCHIDREEEFVFNEMTVDFYGLQVWADPRRRAGFKNPVFNSAEKTSVDEILVPAGEFSVRIRRSFTQDPYPESDSDNKYALIDFLMDAPWELEKLLQHIYYFQSFLALAMRTATWPVLVQVRHPDGENKLVSIHYRPVTEYREVDRLTSSFMYFTLEDALPFLEGGLQNWFEKFEKLERVLQMYNWAISRKLFLDEQFMIYARAAEVYHRQIHDEPYIDDSDYESICEGLKETLTSLMPTCKNERYRSLEQAIHSSLKYANRPSLRRRLKDTGDRYLVYSERLFEDYNRFVDDVVNTRNYLTHFDENDKKRAKLEFRDLYSMRERLRVILEIGLLSELGLNESQIQHIIRGSAVSGPW